MCGVGVDTVRADFSGKVIQRKQDLTNHLLEIGDCGKGNRRLKQYTIPVLERIIDNLNPTGNPFLDLCLWKGRFPGTRSRFCSEKLKHEPVTEYHNELADQFNAVVSWQGVRRDESKARENLPEHDIEFGSWDEMFGMLIYRPILDFSKYSVILLQLAEIPCSYIQQ